MADELQEAVFLPFRGQNWSFCPFLPSRTAILVAFEDKSAHFVLFWSIFSRFWGFSRTKTSFLSSAGLPNSHCSAFRAQNWHFCALLPLGSVIFRPSERKSRVFARFYPSERHFSGLPSAKPHLLRAFGLPVCTIKIVYLRIMINCLLL